MKIEVRRAEILKKFNFFAVFSLSRPFSLYFDKEKAFRSDFGYFSTSSSISALTSRKINVQSSTTPHFKDEIKAHLFSLFSGR